MHPQTAKAGSVATLAGLREIAQPARIEAPEDISSTIRDLQVRRLSRRCAISLTTAAILAPLVFGEARQ